MKVSQLFSRFPSYSMGSQATADITDVNIDSRKVKKGSVFVAIKGTQTDGHDYLDIAVKAGAVALVVEDKERIPDEFDGAVLVAVNSREALVEIAKIWNHDPASGLFCVGITGTNGKTTTSYLVEHLLNGYGWKTGVLGTIDHHIGQKVWGSELTTPDPLTLNKRLAEFVALDANSTVFEVSSHALDQRRADGIPFDAGIFTNLSHDHLDYHNDMESYFEAKARLFKELIPQSSKENTISVINADDSWGKKLIQSVPGKVWSYGKENSQLQFKILDSGVWGSEFELKTPRGEGRFELKLPGEHNVYNAVAAIGTALFAGASLESLKESLAQFSGVPGRLERVMHSKSFPTTFVDYAHTPDALERVLTTLRSALDRSAKSGRLICVFGCGGDRDKEKRPVMGKAASKIADTVIITSDNPRTEPPLQIIEDIKKGIDASKGYVAEVDRRKAIEIALQSGSDDDVILIAGKGHEDYQIIGDKKLDFLDSAVVRDLIGENSV